MAETRSKTAQHSKASKALRTFGLKYPGAHTKSPWPGHCDLAVNDKTFAYLSVEGEPFKISCKLPWSGTAALSLPFAEPTAYGLGKSGWVSASFSAGEAPPISLLEQWIDESYRAQAPKKLVAQLDGAAPAGASSAARSTKGKRALVPRARSAAGAARKAKPRKRRVASR